MRDLISDTGQTAKVLYEARQKSGLSQQDLAQALGKTIITIRNWEQGYGSPSYPYFLRWLDACGANQVTNSLKVINPKIDKLLSTGTRSEKIDALKYMLDHVFTDKMIDQLSYLIQNSQTDAAIQLNNQTIYRHLPLNYRLNISNNLVISYKMAAAADMLSDPDTCKPDIELAEKANAAAISAVMDGKDKYTIF